MARRTKEPTGVMKGLVVLLVLLLAGCMQEFPESLGNRVLDFGFMVSDNRLHDAYNELCSDIKGRVPIDAFTRNPSDAISPLLSEGSWRITDRGRADSARSLDRSIRSGSIEIEAVAGNGMPGYEPVWVRWRVDGRRESGKWKLCGFTQLDDQG